MSTLKPHAVISGATGYVGSAIAHALDARGYALTLLYKENTEKARALLAELSEGQHAACEADLLDGAALALVLEEASELRGIPVLAVHAAGVAPTRRKLLDTSTEEMRAQLEGNVLAGFNFLTACGKRMKETGGTLIGITTDALGDPASAKSLGAYVPAKQALRSVLALLQGELAPSVQVHEITPGFMEGGMNASLPKAFIEIIRAKQGSLMTAQEVAVQVIKLTEHEN